MNFVAVDVCCASDYFMALNASADLLSEFEAEFFDYRIGKGVAGDFFGRPGAACATREIPRQCLLLRMRGEERKFLGA